MPHLITTPREPFLEAIATIAAKCKSLRGEAVIIRDGNTMKFTLGGASFTFDAEGSWDQPVRVPRTWVQTLHSMPPPGDPFTITVEDGRLTMGTFSVGCIIDAVDPRVLPVLPLGADLLIKARLLLKHSKEELERAGIYDEVSKAGPKMQTLVQRAAKALAPFGVTEVEVMALVKAHLEAPSA